MSCYYSRVSSCLLPTACHAITLPSQDTALTMYLNVRCTEHITVLPTLLMAEAPKPSAAGLGKEVRQSPRRERRLLWVAVHAIALGVRPAIVMPAKGVRLPWVPHALITIEVGGKLAPVTVKEVPRRHGHGREVRGKVRVLHPLRALAGLTGQPGLGRSVQLLRLRLQLTGASHVEAHVHVLMHFPWLRERPHALRFRGGPVHLARSLSRQIPGVPRVLLRQERVLWEGVLRGRSIQGVLLLLRGDPMQVRRHGRHPPVVIPWLAWRHMAAHVAARVITRMAAIMAVMRHRDNAPALPLRLLLCNHPRRLLGSLPGCMHQPQRYGCNLEKSLPDLLS